jgi:hypothetical protein
MTVDFIYALYEVQSKTKFYIGRSENPKRRLSEHRYGSKTYKPGDEWKYEYASTLDAAGIKWDMEILMECGPDTEFYEDYFVNLYRNEPLQNMVAGQSEPYMGRDYKSPADFVVAKELHLKQAKIKAVRAPKKIDKFVEPLYNHEKPSERFMSPAMRQILQRRADKQQSG